MMPVEYPHGGPRGSTAWGPNSPPGAIERNPSGQVTASAGGFDLFYVDRFPLEAERALSRRDSHGGFAGSLLGWHARLYGAGVDEAFEQDAQCRGLL